MENANNIDYEKIGLKVGLEIHQQLDTKKLFCDCPSIIRDESADKTIKRVLRASAGETGEVDAAAKAEIEKQKYFVYEYFEDTNCLVELDEEPPHPINQDALNVVLQIAKIVDADIIDQVHIMRKTVVDGSNTSGFQRTALIAKNGKLDIEMNDGRNLKIAIETLCLEEDAARIISKSSGFDTYRLDRLGIPLIEVATGPDIHSPQDVKEVAAFIGMLLRSTGKVKRGLGTIRQDVNVSVIGGSRVEIKGVQDLKLLDKVVENEILRQSNIIRLREMLKERKINMTNEKPKDYSSHLKSSQSKFIVKGLDEGQKLFGKTYKNFKGLFGFIVNPGRRYGSELSDRIKILGLNGLIHTDEDLAKYKISEEISKIYSELDLSPEDSMIFILGQENKCMLAFQKIDDAIRNLIEHGLSKEVRNAKEDATSIFLRPMPGSSRMYPETDVPTFTPDTSAIKRPELIKDKILRYEKDYGLPRQVAKELVLELDFEYFINKYPQIKPIIIAEAIDSMPKEIKTRYSLDCLPSVDQYDQIFIKLNSSEIAKEAVFEILIEIAKGEQKATIDFSKYQTDEDEVAEYIAKIIADKPHLNASGIMGEVMKQFRGKYPGSKIMELIKKFKE